jgi:primosomal protein N' (replication factor Y) (superfamily II helicase)
LLLADVAVPVPLGRSFSYTVPPELAATVAVGVRVLCDFHGRQMLGVVLDVGDGEPPVDASKIKPISALIDPEPVLKSELLFFLRELASYYLAPIGEVLRLALPAVERTRARELSDPQQRALGRTVGGRAVQFVRPVATAAAANAHEGHAAQILEHLRAFGEEPIARLARRWKNARAVVRGMQQLGLVEITAHEMERGPYFADIVDRDSPPSLTPAQRDATDAIEQSLARGQAHTFLLHGVTGSGKTEVYLHAIAAALGAGRGALVLVPEIALTPQLVSRFRARFGDKLAVLHSALGDRDRHAMWKRLKNGSVRVAIGARSALFAPVVDLGLVVVDEEHDGSFKQEDGIRYHARDMAILRAHRAHAVVVLGSATPSLDTEMLVRQGRASRLELPERAHRAAALPAVELIDLRHMGPGPTGHPLVSLPLHRAIEKALAAREQVILFLNRRGFAPSVLCEACGAVVRCKLCSVALTFHRASGGRLVCHYCDFESRLMDACPTCHTGRLLLEGLGTEKLEDAISRAFPEARVARLDRDVASGAKADPILQRMRKGEIDILVGTQMVTKGHDLPNVTLVGVINADAALSMPDYRAAERAFQMLVQVAGRAGRADRAGTVIVQTRDPEHPAIVHAARHDVTGFVERELSDRRELGYPPYTKLALVRVDAADERCARDGAARLAETARRCPAAESGDVQVLGPAPAPIAKLRGRYHFRILFRAKERRPLRSALLFIVPVRDRMSGRPRVVFDVDPVQMM